MDNATTTSVPALPLAAVASAEDVPMPDGATVPGGAVAAGVPLLAPGVTTRPARTRKPVKDLYLSNPSTAAAVTKTLQADRKKDMLGELEDWRRFVAEEPSLAGVYIPHLSLLDSFVTIAREHVRVAASLGVPLEPEEIAEAGGVAAPAAEALAAEEDEGEDLEDEDDDYEEEEEEGYATNESDYGWIVGSDEEEEDEDGDKASTTTTTHRKKKAKTG